MTDSYGNAALMYISRNGTGFTGSGPRELPHRHRTAERSRNADAVAARCRRGGLTAGSCHSGDVFRRFRGLSGQYAAVNRACPSLGAHPHQNQKTP
jgi:hypothetical protein